MPSPIDAAIAAIEAKPGATGEGLARFPAVTIYKVMGKMFAILTVRGTPNVIVKCDTHLIEILREQYQGIGHRSHLDRRRRHSRQISATNSCWAP